MSGRAKIKAIAFTKAKVPLVRSAGAPKLTAGELRRLATVGKAFGKGTKT